jgi:hypothetical protein
MLLSIIALGWMKESAPISAVVIMAPSVYDMFPKQEYYIVAYANVWPIQRVNSVSSLC